MEGEYYFKKSKSKGIQYLTIWKRGADGKDIYKLSLGSAEKCYKKFVRIEELERRDKQLTDFMDKLGLTMEPEEKDKQPNNNNDAGVLDDDKND